MSTSRASSTARSRPSRSTIRGERASAPLLEELEAEVDRLDADDDVRAILLVGAGERAFVAGADISEFPSLREAAEEAHEHGAARGIQKLGHRMDAARTPFVAAIHGFCLGGGLELAMCCDILVASEDAQLGQPESNWLIPGGGGTQRLPRLVGIGRAQYLNMTGDFIDARTAYDWGLVEKVVSGARGAAEAALASHGRSRRARPCSVAVLRELARTTRDLPLEEGLRREVDGFMLCLESEDGARAWQRSGEARAPVHGR